MNPKDSERISRYLDGELTPNEAREVEALLETSPEAREEYATMKQIHETTLDILPETRFARPHLAVRRRRPLVRLAAAAAIAVLFGGVVFGAVQVYEALVAETASTPPPESPPPAPEEAVAPSIVVEDSSGESTTESVLLASEDPPTEPDATESPVSLDELTVPPLKGVVTSVTGEPIAGASVRALAWLGAHPYGLDEDPLRGTARTDAEGRFSLDWPADARLARIEARGYESKDITYAGAVLAPEITAYVELAPETLYSGQVVDTAGNPIPDVRVAAEYAEDPSLVAVTGADGMFQVSSGSRTTLYFSHPDYGLNWIKLGGPEPVQTTLQPGAALRLRVMQGNDPLPGAMVQVVSEIPKALGYALRRETDETGCVLFDQVPTDVDALSDVAVFVTAPNGVKGRLTEIPNLQPGTMTEIALTLPENYPGEVSGTVSDAEGNPLAGIPVIVGVADDLPLFSWTDENGAYTAPLPFGLSQVLVARDLLAPGQVVAEPKSRIVQVNTTGTTVTQDFTITQVEKIVSFVGPDGAPVEDVWLRMWPPLFAYNDSIRWRVATANGRIAVLENEARIYYAYDPLAEQVATFTHLTEDQTALTVTLDQPAGAIAGRIVDPDGKPLAGVSVNSTRPSIGYPNVFAWSDAEGHFRIEPLPLNASYGLDMSLRGYQLLPGSSVTGLQPTQEPTPLEFVMAPMEAGVSGQVVASDGSPLARVYMSLQDGARNVGGGRSALDGTFYFKVAEGVYTMWVMAPDLTATKTLVVAAPSTDNLIALPVQPQPPITDVPPPQSRESERAENNFKQMGLVFKMFANEAAGELFPPLEARQGVFTPEWEKIYPEYLTDTSVLFPDNGVSHCYFAHALTNETQGMAFLDAVQQLGIEAVRDTDIQVGAGKGSAGGDTILRLSESLPQQLFPDQPAAQPLAQANVPILWEVPGEREESGGWVLYMDGHVQWQPYPGPFPMTEQFVTRLRGIMGLPN